MPRDHGQGQSHLPHSGFTDAEVISLRREFALEGATITVKDVMKTHNLSRPTVRHMLIGLTYKHLPEAVPCKKVFASSSPKKACLRDDQVIEFRKKCLDSNGSYGIDEVMRDGDLSRAKAHALLKGTTFKKLPYKVPNILIIKFVRELTDEEVIYYRKEFALRQGLLTIGMISKQVGMDKRRVSSMLRGRTYAHLPHAVTTFFGTVTTRKLFDECALFIRIIYNPIIVDLDTLARAYKTTPAQIANVIAGRAYKNVPFGFRELPGLSVTRRFTEQQVISARKSYSSGAVKSRELCRRMNLSYTGLLNMIHGVTYKDVPFAVPKEKKLRRSRKSYKIMSRSNKKLLIKARPPVLQDHDERIDHRTAA